MSINLPEFDIKLQRDDRGRVTVYDILRGKYVVLTPEEWVRQHFVNYLIEHRGYSPSRMANEVGLRYNDIRRRCDTVIYDAYARPAAIVEYKASTVAITETVFDQIVRYNMVMDVDWLMVSNGHSSFCCRVTDDRKSYRFVRDIPRYDELLTDR